MPTSRIASITPGQIAAAGFEPADSARTSLGASRSKKACAICERPHCDCRRTARISSIASRRSLVREELIH